MRKVIGVLFILFAIWMSTVFIQNIKKHDDINTIFLIVFIIIAFIIVGIWLVHSQNKKEKKELDEQHQIEKIRLDEENRIKLLKEEEEAKKAAELKQKIENTIKTYSVNKEQKILLNAYKDFSKLLEKNQDLIISIKREYIQDFIKISNYLKIKRENIEFTFNSISKSNDYRELNYLDDLTISQINTYNTVLFHSLNMITSLVKNDMIVFYEIYEQFDKLDIFNSNWEKQVAEKLENIKDKLDNISNEISDLNYMTQISLESLNQQVSLQLESIDSSIKFNNLLTTIQSYQLNKMKGKRNTLN